VSYFRAIESRDTSFQCVRFVDVIHILKIETRYLLRKIGVADTFDRGRERSNCVKECVDIIPVLLKIIADAAFVEIKRLHIGSKFERTI
jgi:hypothetical protein